jgi:hypothetical protein
VEDFGRFADYRALGPRFNEAVPEPTTDRFAPNINASGLSPVPYQSTVTMIAQLQFPKKFHRRPASSLAAMLRATRPL